MFGYPTVLPFSWTTKEKKDLCAILNRSGTIRKCPPKIQDFNPALLKWAFILLAVPEIQKVTDNMTGLGVQIGIWPFIRVQVFNRFFTVCP